MAAYNIDWHGRRSNVCFAHSVSAAVLVCLLVEWERHDKIPSFTDVKSPMFVTPSDGLTRHDMEAGTDTSFCTYQISIGMFSF